MRTNDAEGAPGGSEHGVALVLVLTALVLVAALALALGLISATESMVAANQRDGHQAQAAAEAGLERALADLEAIADWTPVLSGQLRSSFADGAPGGERQLVGGSRIDLARIASLASCGKDSCSAADLVLSTADRPWGPDNPRYQLFAYGPVCDLVPPPCDDPRFYVVVMVADDQAENDGDPTADGLTADNPGRGVITVRAEAFGLSGTRRVVEATIARVGGVASDTGYVGQLGGGEANRRHDTRSVGGPGGALARGDIRF